MFFVVLYLGIAIYLFLMLAGLTHKEYMKDVNRPRRSGMLAMALGFLVLGGYYSYYYYYFSTDEGKRLKQAQEEINRAEILKNERALPAQ